MYQRVFVFSTTANDRWLRRDSNFRPYFLRKSQYLPFNVECQGNYWYHFIMSLVWHGPWLRIEPGTSLTQSQYIEALHQTLLLTLHEMNIHSMSAMLLNGATCATLCQLLTLNYSQLDYFQDKLELKYYHLHSFTKSVISVTLTLVFT